MSSLFYCIAVSVYHLVIRIAALFSPKAKAWVVGRKSWEIALDSWRQAQAEGTKVMWMHCASLGEFEQGRPVLEQFREEHPDYKIVLSFYSPSGYEQQRNYHQADYVCYLPADGPFTAKRWVERLSPDIAIFVKYEFWAFHLRTLFKQQVPTFLIAASFRPEQLFFKWYGVYFLRLLKGFTHIFVQSESDAILLEEYGLSNSTVAGDPRVDRVLAIAEEEVNFPQLKRFTNHHKVLIAGSSWPAGEEMLLTNPSRWTSDWKLLIAPHDISERHLTQIESLLTLPYLRYSQITPTTDVEACRILILDTIGMLSRVYYYGDVAYIGGGFGKSIHNLLEPAAHSLPVVFGPKHHKFPEAKALQDCGGGFALATPTHFEAVFKRLQEEKTRADAQRAVKEYVEHNRGAGRLIIAHLSTTVNERSTKGT